MATHPIRHRRGQLGAAGLLLALLVGTGSCGDPAGMDEGTGTDGRTGVRIITTTTGLDLDPDGYGIVVDGTNARAISVNDTVFILLDPGSRTIALTGLEPNCAIEGPGLRTISILDTEVTPIEFVVECSAAPASASLAFVSGGAIYVSQVDGSHLRKLTVDGPTDGRNGEPAWSPDGTRIAFSSADGRGGIAIYVIDADGKNLTRLSAQGAYDVSPTWSPDGKRIAFQSMRDSTGYDGVNSWLDPEIYVMNADGTNQVRLAEHLGHNDYTPAWSPDGRRIAYVSDAIDHTHIYLINTDGTNRVQLTSGDHENYDPAWSPDGSRIVFSRDRDLFVVDADGTHLTLLTSGGSGVGALHGAAWSPDGLTIAFNRTYDCIQDPYGDYSCQVGIWVVPTAGGPMRKLPLPARSVSPTWRP
jgi:Tol biopolymer transport system component